MPAIITTNNDPVNPAQSTKHPWGGVVVPPHSAPPAPRRGPGRTRPGPPVPASPLRRRAGLRRARASPGRTMEPGANMRDVAGRVPPPRGTSRGGHPSRLSRRWRDYHGMGRSGGPGSGPVPAAGRWAARRARVRPGLRPAGRGPPARLAGVGGGSSPALAPCPPWGGPWPWAIAAPRPPSRRSGRPPGGAAAASLGPGGGGLGSPPPRSRAWGSLGRPPRPAAPPA